MSSTALLGLPSTTPVLRTSTSGTIERGFRPQRFVRPAQPGILVVDDEPAVRHLLRVTLQQRGFVVWQAADGHEAIQLYREHRAEIALVLLDVRMPGLDGPRTLAAMQELHPDVVSCFMTGESGEYTEADLVQRGAARVFSKPFGLSTLRSFLWQLATKVGGQRM